VEALTRLDLLSAIEPRFVQGENIAQAYQFVASGNADLGLLALSQVWKDGKVTSGSAWVVPADRHNPIRQDAAILSPGAGSVAAEALLKYLKGDPARAIIRAYGYDL
jgi:molybdate transport system substrate-binding protein